MINALPDFPWDTLVEVSRLAGSHPGGICDLSVGTPVDPTPQVAIDALTGQAPGYPSTAGTPELRTALRGYLERRWLAAGLEDDAVLPVIGTKELVAWLPTLLGICAGQRVAIPQVAYPTYEVGAILAGAEAIRSGDSPLQWRGPTPAVLWLNSPANPSGEVWSAGRMRAWVDWSREHEVVVASDECYGEFGWEAEPVSILDPRVSGGDPSGLLAVHSMSKRSNAAGYRLGFVGGDREIVARLLAVRKHAGLMMPTTMQQVMAALVADQEHVVRQRERYSRRRATLRPALESAGFRIDHSTGGLYLWATREEPCRQTVHWLASRGILVAPGDFYGDADHVRIALTAPDERIQVAAERLS